MRFSAAALGDVLRSAVPQAAGGLLVAVSGGLDSACLLTALAELPASARRDLPLRAVHVDHGLQSAAADMRRACEALCGRLGVPLTVLAVAVRAARGESLEAAARAARYAALAQTLGRGECLLTAHHADDQAETLLLQLLRGAGLKGLSAMPQLRPWRGGWHLRPLLDVTRRDLHAFGASRQVAAESDPMNSDLRFDRSYLRLRLWPLIEARWPGAPQAVARAARHMADAQALLERATLPVLERLRDGDALAVTGLRTLDPAEREGVVRQWLTERGAKPPSSTRLREALRQIDVSQGDHQPAVAWGEHALRRYRDRLCLAAARPLAFGADREWREPLNSCLDLDGLGVLRLRPQSGGLDPARLPDALTVRRRRGGERLKPAHGARTHSVQHLCQEAGVLPWMRDALPLLFAGDALIAVGDLWQDARWCVARGAPGVACVWEGAPALT